MSDTSPGPIYKQDNIRMDYLSAIIGIFGLTVSFIPYLSPGGIFLGLSAIFLGIKAMRSGLKKFWAGLGILTGSLSIISLVLVVFLLIFF
ncbi:MAG: hypothetical protein R8P61_33165 [Bacteroidia bacterium]|nr:hypothetical protein [Bacteroidia bacterium]